MSTLSIKEINAALQQLPNAGENPNLSIPIKVYTRLEQLKVINPSYNSPNDITRRTVDLRVITFKSVVYMINDHPYYEWEIESYE